jgi:hypothetical protein
MDRQEDCRLIAEFLGWHKSLGITYHKDTKVTTTKHFDFVANGDWNGLMKVVEKVESLGVCVEIRENVCYISPFPNNYISELEQTKLQATFKAVVEFIKWYNYQTN